MWKLKHSTYNMLPILVATCNQSNHANQDTTINPGCQKQSGYYFLNKLKLDFLSNQDKWDFRLPITKGRTRRVNVLRLGCNYLLIG